MKRWLAAALCTVAFPATGGAHVLDGYLQSAQLALKPTGVDVELRLIPGVQLADGIFARMDTDADGQLSAAEERSYVQKVLRDLVLKVDEQPTALSLQSLHFPARDEMRDGIGIIRLDLTALAPLAVTGTHTVYFRNDHRADVGAYLVNALVPATNDLAITGQERDSRQQGLRISLRCRPAPTRTPLHLRDALIPCLLIAMLLLRWVSLLLTGSHKSSGSTVAEDQDSLDCDSSDLHLHVMNKDQKEGLGQNIKGRVKEATGVLTGNKHKESEGASDRAQGAVRKAVGDLKHGVAKALDK